MLKKLFLGFVALSAILSTNAQTFSMSTSDVTVATGSDAVITVNLENSVEMSDMQLFLTLPDGVIVPKDEYDEYQIAIDPTRNPKHAATCNYDAGMFKMAIASVTARKIEAGSGPVAYITIHADCPAGVYSFSFSEVHLSRITEENMAVDIPLPDFGATLTVTEAEVKRYGDNQLYAKDVTINEGENAQLLLGYNSTSEVYEYAADITLPDGVSATTVTFNTVVTDVENFTNEWSLDGSVLKVEGAYGGGRKDVPAAIGDNVYATAILNTQSLTAGEYDIVLSNQKLFNDDDMYPESYTAKLIVVKSETPSVQCEAPVISINEDGNIVATSATEGAKIHTTVTCEDIDTFHHENGTPVEMKGQYLITSYATADGYADSEPTTAMLAWTKKSSTSGVEILEADTDRAVLIYTIGDNIVISGVETSENVGIYTIDGTTMYNGQATETTFTVPVSLTKGTVYIVTVSGRSFKYVL